MENRKNSFGTASHLEVNGRVYTMYQIQKVGLNTSRLPYSIRILLENLLRNEDGLRVTRRDVEAILAWRPRDLGEQEISFMPSRVILQDFTGVPCAADLAAMRDAIVTLGGDAQQINPVQPVDLVIDHSVQVDAFGNAGAFDANATLEMERNQERYEFLKWAQTAFEGFRVVPPDTGIVHQVNLEYLASIVDTRQEGGEWVVFPDTLVGTDSHTTMINGAGVVGWGVGGIEAEAAMLNQPITMLIPEVIGFKLTGRLPEGATATDLVLTVTQMLRKRGVVGRFVEFFGSGLDALSLPDRATLANMAPEYGATIGFFPVDQETLNYLRLTGRDEERVALVEAYCRAQGLFRTADSPDPEYTDVLNLDLSSVVPSLAGPRRPQDRVPLSVSRRGWRSSLVAFQSGASNAPSPEAVARWVDGTGEVPREWTPSVQVEVDGEKVTLGHGSVVIAAITSCTNTSNPTVMVAAGLLAKKAVDRGLSVQPWVKTSLAPGSQVVTDYLQASGLQKYLDALRFNLVGYGCTTCIGNSGPLHPAIARGIKEGGLVAVSVLSGNRNFEGRISASVKANYLASPPLVVAYALAGTMDIDLAHEPLGADAAGNPVFLSDLWPSQEEIRITVQQAVQADMFRSRYQDVFAGTSAWQSLKAPTGQRYQWSDTSTYIKQPPFFDGLARQPSAPTDIRGARCLALLGDSVTTDHISPAGSIGVDSPAGKYLVACGVSPKDFNSYGARRGNHEVMVRGTFGNIRLKNLLAPDTEGGVTRHIPSLTPMSIYDASLRYQEEKVPLVILAGWEYGTGSSRDWAAKGTLLLGVRAVIARSFERIHRSNLIGMGVLPLQFNDGEDPTTLGLTGQESFSVLGISEGLSAGSFLTVEARRDDGKVISFSVRCRIDTPVEVLYYQHGGILQYSLRNLVGSG